MPSLVLMIVGLALQLTGWCQDRLTRRCGNLLRKRRAITVQLLKVSLNIEVTINQSFNQSTGVIFIGSELLQSSRSHGPRRKVMTKTSRRDTNTIPSESINIYSSSQKDISYLPWRSLTPRGSVAPVWVFNFVP